MYMGGMNCNTINFFYRHTILVLAYSRHTQKFSSTNHSTYTDRHHNTHTNMDEYIQCAAHSGIIALQLFRISRVGAEIALVSSLVGKGQRDFEILVDNFFVGVVRTFDIL